MNPDLLYVNTNKILIKVSMIKNKEAKFLDFMKSKLLILLNFILDFYLLI